MTLNRQAVEILGSERERIEGRNITELLGDGVAEILGPRRNGRWCGIGRWRSGRGRMSRYR